MSGFVDDEDPILDPLIKRARKMPKQRPATSRQDYGTPSDFLVAVEHRFGRLTFDLACRSDNAKTVGGYFFDKGIDALKEPWGLDHPEGNLWLNPPYDDIGKWAEKCASESVRRYGQILFLVPASVGANWFAEHVHRKAIVLALSPRLTFEGCTECYPKDLMLCVYGHGLSGFDTWRWRP